MLLSTLKLSSIYGKSRQVEGGREKAMSFCFVHHGVFREQEFLTEGLLKTMLNSGLPNEYTKIFEYTGRVGRVKHR